MADVIMPQMGESIAEGTVTKWLKNVGDRVERDEPLFEISTDKVDAEIPSPAAGVLREIRVAPGDTVPVNTVVGVIAVEAAAATLSPPPPPPAPPEADTSSSSSARSAASDGHADDDIPPVAYEIEGEAPSAGAPGLLRTTPPDATLPPPAWGSAPPSPPASPPPADERPRAAMSAADLRLTRSSPVVRRIAAEHDVDLSGIAGTGIGGRVTKQDILGHIGSRSAGATTTQRSAPVEARPLVHEPQADGASEERQPPATAEAPSPPSLRTPPARPREPFEPTGPAPSAPVGAASAPHRPSGGGRVEVVPMSPIRKRTAEHMVLSKRTSAHVSTVFEVDMTRIDQLRADHRRSFEERGVKLTYLPFVLKAVVDALKAFPILNASIEGDDIVYRKDVNLGIAVALDWGLIVPVVHHADEKNVLGLARAVSDLAERSRTKKLRLEEVQGGTFTVTNPGVFGSLFGTPIINQPQVAILGIGTIEKRPVVRDEAIAIRTMAYLALTFDHRLVDGADADRFMAHLKTTLQEFDEAGI